MTPPSLKPDPAPTVPDAAYQQACGLLEELQQLSNQVLECSLSGDTETLTRLVNIRETQVKQLTTLIDNNPVFGNLSAPQQADLQQRLALCRQMDRQIEQNFHTVLTTIDSKMKKTLQNKHVLDQYQLKQINQASLLHNNQA